MNTDLETQIEHAERLSVLMQGFGFAIWQLQELETTVATYVVIRVHAYRGIGTERGEDLLKKAESRTLGSLLAELVKTGVVESPLASDLREMLERRNWLVHRVRRENRGILASMEKMKKLLQQCETIAVRSVELNKTLATELERYVRESGVDPAVIDAEADRLARSWGLLDQSSSMHLRPR